MVGQARAEVTRQRVIAAAVEIFEEFGYGDTSLSDIIDRAGVTKGAFYHHFHNKESVAGAIIEDADAKIQDAFVKALSSSSFALENLIRCGFVLAEMTEHDNRVRVGNRLRQALTNVSPAGAHTYTRGTVIAGAVKQAVAEGDLFDDIDADVVGHTIWAAVLGTRLLSDATGEDIFAHLLGVWTVILHGVVPPQRLPYFQQFATRQAQQYAGPKDDSPSLENGHLGEPDSGA